MHVYVKFTALQDISWVCNVSIVVATESIVCVHYSGRMQRLTAMVFSSLPRTTTGCTFPVHPANHCLPAICVHDTLHRRRMLGTSAALSRTSFSSLSYKRHLMRELCVSCRRESHGTRHDKPDEQLVNTCPLFYSAFHRFVVVGVRVNYLVTVLQLNRLKWRGHILSEDHENDYVKLKNICGLWGGSWKTKT